MNHPFETDADMTTILLVPPGKRPTEKAISIIERLPGKKVLLTIVPPSVCPVDDDEGLEAYRMALSEAAEVIDAVPHMHCGSPQFHAVLVCREFDAQLIIVDGIGASMPVHELAVAVAPTRVLVA